MTTTQFLVTTAIVAVGAVVQGTVGFGLGLFAAPLLMLIDPRLIPGPLLVGSGVLTLLMARREWHAVQGRDLAWSLGGRVVGTLVALAVLTTLARDQLDLLFGALVLAAVALTSTRVRLRPGPKSLAGAGALSGLMGTTTTVGGPPMALLYQHEPGPRLRGTLAAFFVVGVVMSLAGLRVIGRFGALELRLAALVVPGILLGYALSRKTVGVLDRGFIRPAVLGISAAAALLVIGRQVL
jgi:uncharacterized membrane protein YfcA